MAVENFLATWFICYKLRTEMRCISTKLCVQTRVEAGRWRGNFDEKKKKKLKEEWEKVCVE